MDTKHTFTTIQHEIISEISSWKKYNQQTIDKNKEEFEKDFVYALEWKAEETYKAHLKNNMLTRFLKNCFESGFESAKIEFLDTHKNYISRSYNIRKRTTCAVMNEASLWKYEICIDVLNDFEKLIANATKNATE